MKSRTRLVSLLLAVLMLASFAAGCNNDSRDAESGSSPPPAITNDSGAPAETDAPYQSGQLPIVSDSVSFTFWWPFDATTITSRGESYAVIEMEKRTNVHIDWKEPSTVNASENLNLMFASDDMTNFIHMTSNYPNGNAAGVADGVFLVLNDYIDEYCPTYKNIIDNWGLEFEKNTKLDSGDIFAFYNLTETPEPPWCGMLVRQDKLDEIGMAQPVTIADWERVLTGFRDNTDLIPITISSNFNTSKAGFFTGSAFMSAYGLANDFYQVDGTVKYGPAQPEFKEYLTLMNDWYSKDLVDKEFASRTYDVFKGYELMGSFGHAWGVAYDILYQLGYSQDPNIQLRAVQSPVLNPGDTVEFRFVDSVIGSPTVITSSLDHDIDVACKWFDYQYTYDARDLNIWGQQGICWEYDDSGNKYFMGEFLDAVLSGESYATARYCRDYNISGPGLSDWTRHWVLPNATGGTSYEMAAETLVWAEDGTANCLPTGMTMTGDESFAYSAIYYDVETYVVEYTCKVIMGMIDLDTFDNFIAQLKTMNIDEAVAIKQASYDRYMSR
jgi:putative aldouronate transport system substrate-binding protein